MNKKAIISYGIPIAISALWILMWNIWIEDLLYTVEESTGIFFSLYVDFQYGAMIGMYILSVIWAFFANRSNEMNHKVSRILAIAALVVWVAPIIVSYFRLMSWQGLYEYDWVKRINLLPFNGKLNSLVSRFALPFFYNFDNWRNILFFFPIGILTAGAKKKKLWISTAIGGIILIEILQLITRIGCCDIDDVIYRLIGLFIGFGIGYLVTKKTSKTM